MKTMTRAAARRSPVAAILAAAALATSGAGCASTPEPEGRDLPGCYYFERDASARELNLPWGIRLLDEALDPTLWPGVGQREGARRAATLTPAGDRDHPFGYWIPAAGDSLEVGYPGGGGLVLDVVVDGQVLSGVARPVGDVLDPGSAAGPHPVTLRLARCPEEDQTPDNSTGRR